MAKRYEFYVRVARTISHERSQRTSEIVFLPRVFLNSSTCNMVFDAVKAGAKTQFSAGRRKFCLFKFHFPARVLVASI